MQLFIGLEQVLPQIREPLSGLSNLVRIMRDSGINCRAKWSGWAKSSEGQGIMDRVFGYDILPPNVQRPRIGTLVKPHFHPDLPLVGFNYTPLAHNTLFAAPEGWTPPLKLCRGIVFDLETGELVAFPFPKFFNFGEQAEEAAMPESFSYATLKYDGHLGIIFFYRGRPLIKTRGDFCHRSSAIGQEAIDRLAEDLPRWHELATNDQGGVWTILVEIIHPETSVLVNYDCAEKLALIGSYWYNYLSCELFELNLSQLMLLGGYLGLETPERWRGSIMTDDLLVEVKRRDINNREGWVAVYPDGRRVKFKYETYIGLMVKEKLSLTYLMRRALSGNLERMIATLPEEVYGEALKMLGRISLALFSGNETPKELWRKLYLLLPEGERTDSYKAVCREFAKAYFPRLGKMLCGIK